MKFVLAAIILAAILAVVILLLLCCFRRYTDQCADRRRPHSLQFDDDASRKHLLEEGDEQPPNQRSPSQKRLPPQNRYFVLGGHRFEATASGYRQIDDEAAYNPSDAQKLALQADDSNATIDAHHEDMIGADDNPKPRKTRHPLAIQFSAMAHAAEVNGSLNLEPNATRQFMHDTKPSDNYVWPSRGGPATPIHVEWGGSAPAAAAAEQAPAALDEHDKGRAAAVDQPNADKDDSGLVAASNYSVPEDAVPKEEPEDNQELLVKADPHMVPKPKSKKGKKRLPEQQLET